MRFERRPAGVMGLVRFPVPLSVRVLVPVPMPVPVPVPPVRVPVPVPVPPVPAPVLVPLPVPSPMPVSTRRELWKCKQTSARSSTGELGARRDAREEQKKPLQGV